jgi:hypothetical protein
MTGRAEKIKDQEGTIQAAAATQGEEDDKP